MRIRVSGMTDAELVEHMREHYGSQQIIVWKGEGHRLHGRKMMEAYHDFGLHPRTEPDRPGHIHDGYQHTGWSIPLGANVNGWEQKTPCLCLDPPRHDTTCPGRMGLLVLDPERHGPSAIERLWMGLDQAMDLLQSGECENPEGTKGFARGLACGIATLQSPLSPDIDEVRREAMERWRRRQADAE